jgi:hypothetical protein
MKYLLLLAFLFLGVSTASAQITLTSNDFVTNFAWNGVREYSTESNLQVGVGLIAASGANQTWDFSKSAFTLQANDNSSSTLLPFSASMPLASDPDFATATHAFKIVTNTMGTIYEYLHVTEEGLWILGLVSEASVKFISYTPAVQQFKFPLTYQTAWTTSFQERSSFDSSTVTTETRDVIADSYGTLVIPPTAGVPSTSVSALRLKTKSVTIVTSTGFSDTSTTYTYDWYSRENVLATINAASDNTPSSMSYSVPLSNAGVIVSKGNAFELSLSENPLLQGTRAELAYTLTQQADIEMNISDALGRQIGGSVTVHGEAGKNSIAMDASMFTNGTYFIHITDGTQSAVRKLVIAR